jgi:hypothetical protein
MHALRACRTAAELAVIVLFLGLVSCGGAASTSPSLVIPGGDFIPDFTFVWQNTADHTNTYTLITDNPGKSSGNFIEGSSETLNGVNSPLTGTYNNHNITMNIQRASGNVAASGGFTDNDTIKLQFGSTIVTLARIKQ